MRDTHRPMEDYDEPGRYEIRLKGHLDERWAERFAGLTFSPASDGTTILFGPVVDQAALHGVLSKVRTSACHCSRSSRSNQDRPICRMSNPDNDALW